MPIYEYRCPDCSHEFEEIQKMSDDPVRLCPSCGKENVTKLLSAAAFHLKGGGWANDNYGLKAGSSESGSGAASAPVSSSDSAPVAASSTPAAPAAASTPAPAAPAPSSGGSSSGGE